MSEENELKYHCCC